MSGREPEKWRRWMTICRLVAGPPYISSIRGFNFNFEITAFCSWKSPRRINRKYTGWIVNFPHVRLSLPIFFFSIYIGLRTWTGKKLAGSSVSLMLRQGLSGFTDFWFSTPLIIYFFAIRQLERWRKICLKIAYSDRAIYVVCYLYRSNCAC